MVKFNYSEKSISRLFHERTEIHKISKSRGRPPLIFWKIFYKKYFRFPSIYLPKQFTKSYLEKIILRRRSMREFTEKPIDVKTLSHLLYFSFGITFKNNEFRAYPSAGARYPIEVYPILLKGENIENGVYHYNVKDHKLEKLRSGNFKKFLFNVTCQQKWIKKASVVFILTGILNRTLLKYGERGYRYVLLEAGHAAQNMYLIATSLGLGCCTIGGFLDKEIDRFLDLEKTDEKTIYMLAIGSID